MSKPKVIIMFFLRAPYMITLVIRTFLVASGLRTGRSGNKVTTRAERADRLAAVIRLSKSGGGTSATQSGSMVIFTR